MTAVWMITAAGWGLAILGWFLAAMGANASDLEDDVERLESENAELTAKLAHLADTEAALVEACRQRDNLRSERAALLAGHPSAQVEADLITAANMRTLARVVLEPAPHRLDTSWCDPHGLPRVAS